ncbi:uncharacterized protein LOC105697700 [Orussus abietinus]|uniref:uncharacterized protein LOC105697700 n=1 Tax=Orussus abietinus TaxID=222816 RepID=UPI000625227E|nr:uncharacterized protein LOC105697700 [Orussus abietinus]
MEPPNPPINAPIVETPKELIGCQKNLKQEEEFILKLISNIDSQIHALQVEQLHILNSLNASKSPPMARKAEPITQKSNDFTDMLNQALNLDIPSLTSHFSEEEEEDD